MATGLVGNSCIDVNYLIGLEQGLDEDQTTQGQGLSGDQTVQGQGQDRTRHCGGRD